MTPADSTDVSSGSRSPGPVSAAQMSPGDIRVMSVITGPRSATQMTAAPATETTEDTERARRALLAIPPRPLGTRSLASCSATGDGGGHGARSADYRRGDEGEPALLVLGQAAADSVYLMNAMPAGVGCRWS